MIAGNSGVAYRYNILSLVSRMAVSIIIEYIRINELQLTQYANE